MKTNVVSGKSVPGALPPPLSHRPPGSERLDNPATPAGGCLLPSAARAAVATAAAGTAAAENTVETTHGRGTRAGGAIPVPEPAPLMVAGGIDVRDVLLPTAACPKELDAATSIPTVARTSAGKIALGRTLDAPVNIAIILARLLGPEESG